MNRAIFALALAIISTKGGSAADGELTLDADSITTDKTSVSGIKVEIEDGSTAYTMNTLDAAYELFPAAPTGAAKADGPNTNDDSEVFGITGLHPGTPYIIEITGASVTGGTGSATVPNALITNFVTKPETPNPDVNLKVLSANGAGEMCVMWYVSKMDTSYYTDIVIEAEDTTDSNQQISKTIDEIDDDEEAGIECWDMTSAGSAVFTDSSIVQFKMKLKTDATDSLTEDGALSNFGANTKSLAESNQGIKAEKVSDSCYYYDDEWSCLIKVMPDYLGDGMDEMLDYHYTIEDADDSLVDHHDDCSTSTGTKPVRTCEHWVTGMEKEDHDYTMKFTKVCFHGKNDADDCVDFPDEAAYHYTFKSSAVSVQAVGVLGMTLIALIAKKLF